MSLHNCSPLEAPISGQITFFGLVLRQELPFLTNALKQDMFGLVVDPVEHIIKGYNSAFTEQTHPALGSVTRQAAISLGLSFEWRASSIPNPASDTEVMLYDALSQKTILCRQTATSADREPLHTPSPEEQEILDRWPDLFDLLDRTGAARLHIVDTHHEMMRFLSHPPEECPTWPLEGRLSATAHQRASA